jgi:hypothetical protein
MKRAGGAVEERDPIEEEPARESAEQEVFHRRLFGLVLSAAHARHDVEGDRQELQANEQHEKVPTCGHEHAAGGRPQDEEVELSEGNPLLPEIPLAKQDGEKT